MIIPLNWLSDYISTTKSPQELANSFTTLGLMQEKPIKDSIIELEHRMDRADWLSILGCARDLAAFEGIKLNEPKINNHPLKQLDPKNKIKIKVKTKIVNRFNTRVFKNVKVQESPKWLKDRLEAYGIESKNNLVDITNFVMVEYGQPMHTQDIDKLEGNTLTLRETGAGESITTLLGTKVKLDSGMFVISSGKTQCVIGGIVGGNTTGITKNTTEIILDAGNYDQRHIRANSRKLKIMNETVIRYDKYLDPRLCQIAINRATDLILELAGGTVYENDDYYPEPVIPSALTLTYTRLQTLSGLELKSQVVKSRLKALGYTILSESKDQLELELPYWRTDIEVEDDLIADVLRIGNYNTLPDASLTTPVPADITTALYTFEDRLRDLMVSLGGHEHITSPLIASNQNSDQVILANSLSSEQDALRTTLTETLTPILTTYQKHGKTHSVLFEIAKSFVQLKKRPLEIRELAFVSNSDIRPTLTSLLSLLGISYTLKPNKDNSVAIISNDISIGTFTLNSCTLSTTDLLKVASIYSPITTNIPNSTSLDISLILPTDMSFSTISKLLYDTSPSLSSIKVLEHYQAKNSLLIRLTWEDKTDLDKTRLSLVKVLEKNNIKSRSK